MSRPRPRPGPGLRATVLRWRLLACTLAACSLALGVPLAAHAAPTSYVALGDSYTSSPLTGESSTGVPSSCLQSTNNYPHLVAAALQAAALTDVSCAGALTADMFEPQTNEAGEGTNPPQLQALTSSTSLVTVGIGANDANVYGAAVNCAQIDLLAPTGSDCEAHYSVGGVDHVSQTIDQVAPDLAAVYQSIHARAPHARVLAVGYPDLLPVNGTSCPKLVPISPGDISWLNSLTNQLNQMIATTAAANHVQYVDTYTPTLGHDVCQALSTAGFVGVLPQPGLNALHPNELGQQTIANAVLQAISHPVATRRAAEASVHLKLIKASIGRRSVTATGTISTLYRGRVVITFETRHRGHAIDLHGTTTVVHGRVHAVLAIPHRYAGVLHRGSVTATSRAGNGLRAGRAHRYVR